MFVMLWLYWIIGLSLSVVVSSYIIRYDRELGYTFLAVLFAGFILISNILVPRLIKFSIGECDLSIVTGSLLWPFTAQLSDMVNEIYGKRKTIIAFLFGYIINLLFVVFILMAKNTQPIWTDDMETFWLTYFLPSGRVLIASTISFFICQTLDAYVFSYFKERYRTKEDRGHISITLSLSSWRNIVSDVINMLCDGFIFTIIAFIFVLPTDSIFHIALSSIAIKAFMAIIDTPLFAIFKFITKDEIRQK